MTTLASQLPRAVKKDYLTGATDFDAARKFPGTPYRLHSDAKSTTPGSNVITSQIRFLHSGKGGIDKFTVDVVEGGTLERDRSNVCFTVEMGDLSILQNKELPKLFREAIRTAWLDMGGKPDQIPNEEDVPAE